MYKIYGKHAIKAILNNPKRKNVKQIEDYVMIKELFIPTDLDEILVNYDRIILVDNTTDVRNIGSIIRSAAILGFAVLLRDKCCINDITVKCASGGMDQTSITFVKDMQNTINKIKKHDFWFVALNENGRINPPKFNKIVLVVGAEGNGISNLVLSNCDYTWQLDSSGEFNIYNASVSAAIAMYLIKL